MNELDDDDQGDDEDRDAAARRRAREILARTEPTREELVAQEERRQRIRGDVVDAIIADQQRRASTDARDMEARNEAVRLYRTVEASRPPSLPPKQWSRSTIAWQRYAFGLEHAIGTIVGRLQRRHESAELRATSTEERLAAIEGRLADLEARVAALGADKVLPLPFLKVVQPEKKQTGP